ncbi:unnamed protein product [Leuciscus chuanchicus]
MNASVSCSVNSTISSAKKRIVAPEPYPHPPVSSPVLLPALCQLSKHLTNSAYLQR